jgi:hypothetical protein
MFLLGMSKEESGVSLARYIMSTALHLSRAWLHYLPLCAAITCRVDFVVVSSVHELASGTSASCVAAFLATRQRLFS